MRRKPKMKEWEELVQFERDRRSQELFNKYECELDIAQRVKLEEYLHDLAHPEFRPVVIRGYTTDYMISNTGIVRNKNGKTVSLHCHHKGYQSICITYDTNKHISTFVHRLVAQAFIPNPDNKPQVNHINGNKECNWVGNLEWNTCLENIQHAWKNGLAHHGFGEDANSSKYKNEDIHKVCKLLETGQYKNTEISKMTGIDVSTISKIKCKEDWTIISDQYDIKKPNGIATGAASASSKYSEKDIHTVCKLLESGMNMVAIAKQTGVNYNVIYAVKKGMHWKDISSQYNIPGRSGNSEAVISDKLEQCSTTIGQLRK